MAKAQNPLAKYELKSFGQKKRNTEGAFEGRQGNAARDERRDARKEQRPATFAELQADGIARPAPPTAQMFTGQQANLAAPAQATPRRWWSVPPPRTTPPRTAQPRTATVAPRNLPTNQPLPSGGGSYDYGARRKSALANLQAQFGGQKQALDEDNARRGLWASTYGSGRMGDLEGQQSRAMATLEQDLLREERDDESKWIDLLRQLMPYFLPGGR